MCTLSRMPGARHSPRGSHAFYSLDWGAWFSLVPPTRELFLHLCSWLKVAVCNLPWKKCIQNALYDESNHSQKYKQLIIISLFPTAVGPLEVQGCVEGGSESLSTPFSLAYLTSLKYYLVHVSLSIFSIWFSFTFILTDCTYKYIIFMLKHTRIA